LPEKVKGEEMVVGMREPLALVERSAEGRPVIASAEVVPCPPEKKRLDDEAVAAKKFVEVPNVPANDWKVDDPEAKRLLATKTPVEVALPVKSLVEYSWVLEAVEAKRFVDVALVVVPKVVVRLAIVDEANEYNPLVNPIKVVVAFAFVPPNVVLVKGKLKRLAAVR
jgi:hypothetical protein